MTRSEFLETIDDILELPAGTLKGTEALEDLEAWDSLAVVSFIASVHAFFGETLVATAVKNCTSIPGLLALVEKHFES